MFKVWFGLFSSYVISTALVQIIAFVIRVLYFRGYCGATVTLRTPSYNECQAGEQRIAMFMFMLV